MKGFSKLTLGLLVAAVTITCPRAGAQAFGLSVTPSANSILVGNSVTYTITVTNLGAGLFDTFVTNFFASSQPQTNLSYNASSTQGTSFATTNAVVFELGPFAGGVAAQLILTITPTAAGPLTNSVTVAEPSETTNVVSTNVVVQVTNVVTLADLGVTMIGPGQVVITNDWMTYGVTVSNAGPSAAPNVMLTNIVPAGVIGISSPNQNSGSNSIPLGTLPSGGFTNLFFTVEPTNAGTLPFSASVSSSSVMDTNTANNFASTNLVVTNYLSGPLAIATNSGQVYNPQNGLVEQFVTVTNNTNYIADAVRVIVAGLTTNRLFNAVGTNSGNPFVYYSTSLGPGQTAGLLLQYAANAYFPLTNGQLFAFAVPAPNWTPPPITATSTNINISRIVELPNGNILIEWPSKTNRTYTVVYSDNISFSNAMIAPPCIVAPANRTQWIDYGPPTTVSVPTNTARFYRVFQNP